MRERTRLRYVLGTLMTIFAFNLIDRLALGLVAEDLKRDFALNDTELGLLSGIAFALFYSTMGIPIARWADRGNRVTIIGVTTALWSAAVALCGATRNFAQLMLARVVIGVGEAGCVPPAHSLIADLFPREERPRAVSTYMQGYSISVVLGYFVAGWLNQYYGWRMMFVLIGLPGLALAALAWLTLPEPRRQSPVARASVAPEVSITHVCASLWRNVTFRRVLYGYVAVMFFSYGSVQWTPVFFVRSFGFQTGRLGTWLGLMYAAGAIGTYWGGEWATRRAARDERRQLRGMALAFLACAVTSACTYLPAVAPNAYVAFAWVGISTSVGAVVNGPLLAVIQTLVPERRRATSIALVYLVGNLVGIGLGPLAVGAMSDALAPWLGAESVRYAVLLVCPACAWAAWHLWIAANSVAEDIAATQFSGRQPEVAVSFGELA
jgi:MFS family permease